MSPDPHPPVPDHPQTPDGWRVYDPGCWMCRDLTAQPPPTAMPKGASGS